MEKPVIFWAVNLPLPKHKVVGDVLIELLGIAGSLTARNRPDHQKWLRAVHDGFGQRGLRRFTGQIFFAGKKPDERPTETGSRSITAG